MKFTLSLSIERNKPPDPAATVSQAQVPVLPAPSADLPDQPNVGATWPHSGAHGYVHDEDAPYL